MRSLLLVIPGHLGKDVGATATLKSDGDGSPSFLGKLQEERWINLQQAIGFCLAHSLSPLRIELDVRLVIPNNKDQQFFDKGLIKVYDVCKSVFGLTDRVELANRLNADVIEIHNNAAPFAASGFETMCFAKEDATGKITESYQIADAIMKSAQKNMSAKVRGTKPIYDHKKKQYIEREIYILKSTLNNCVITEAGFLSNTGDLNNIDVDLDGYNEMIGASIWLGYQEAYTTIKGGRS